MAEPGALRATSLLPAIPRRQRQAQAVGLSVRRERNRVDGDEHGGHHVVRQRSREGGAQHARRYRRIRRCDEVGDQTRFARNRFPRDDDGVADARNRAQDVLDFADVDAKAADLDLEVLAPDMDQVAVRQRARRGRRSGRCARRRRADPAGTRPAFARDRANSRATGSGSARRSRRLLPSSTSRPDSSSNEHVLAGERAADRQLPLGGRRPVRDERPADGQALGGAERVRQHALRREVPVEVAEIRAQHGLAAQRQNAHGRKPLVVGHASS